MGRETFPNWLIQYLPGDPIKLLVYQVGPESQMLTFSSKAERCRIFQDGYFNFSIVSPKPYALQGCPTSYTLRHHTLDDGYFRGLS